MSKIRLAEMTWQEAREAAESGRFVLVPIGSTEAHGPHLPLDVDTHQAEHVAMLVAEGTNSVVAPALPYGYASTWMGFPGTVTLTAATFETVVYEIAASLVQHGFQHVILLNGHRPNGTVIDVAARRLIDNLSSTTEAQVTALSYWEPGAAAVHAIRRSAVGGMGHACEFETSVQLATRPELVHMDRLEGVQTPLVGWDLVAPMPPNRTYGPWPGAQEGHPAVFGDPTVASADSGERFLAVVVEALVTMVGELQAGRGGSYAEREAP
jgi:creatinine amidohydrolase